MRNLIRINHYPLWVSAAAAVDATTSCDGDALSAGGASASNDMGLVLSSSSSSSPSPSPSPPSSLTSAVSLHHFDLHRRHYSILLSGKTPLLLILLILVIIHVS